MRAVAVLYLAALFVRVLAGLLHPDPAYPDSFYYTNLAGELAAGRGLTIDYIWNFVDVGGGLPADPRLPVPANGHWMPLAAFVQVPFRVLLGDGPIALGLPFWLIGAAAAPLCYLVARDARLPVRVAVAGGALTAVPGGLVPFLGQPDNFALFMPLGLLALWLCARAAGGDRRAFAAGGLVVGLATLSRTDGLLLAVPYLLVLGGLVRGGSLRAAVPPALGFAAGCLVLLAPWYARQLAVFGSLSPSAAGGRILWITDYGQLFSVSSDTSLGSFVAHGPVDLVLSRLGGLVAALGLFAVVPLLFFLVPFVLLGAWQRRAERAFMPWRVYAATLFLFSALLFAVHVPHGTFLHSAVALVPHAYLLAALGVEIVVRRVARSMPHWEPARAARGFLVVAVVGTALGAAVAQWRIGSEWARDDAVRAAIVPAVRALPRGDVVMSSNPGAYRYAGGVRGIVTPEDPLPVVERVLRAYRARWLLIERDHVVRSLRPLLSGAKRPAWLSRPVAVASDPAGAGSGPAIPAAALYAVCLEPADERCPGD